MPEPESTPDGREDAPKHTDGRECYSYLEIYDKADQYVTALLEALERNASQPLEERFRDVKDAQRTVEAALFGEQMEFRRHLGECVACEKLYQRVERSALAAVNISVPDDSQNPLQSAMAQPGDTMLENFSEQYRRDAEAYEQERLQHGISLIPDSEYDALAPRVQQIISAIVLDENPMPRVRKQSIQTVLRMYDMPDLGPSEVLLLLQKRGIAMEEQELAEIIPALRSYAEG